MAPSRKSFHESALNCCETILHLYSVFRTVLLHIDFFCLPRGRFPNNALQPAPEFVRQHVLFLIQDCQPSTELAVVPPMMLQPGNSERARVTLPVKEERLAPAKMRYPGTPDFLGEMPIAIRAILFQFVNAMMPVYVLQIRHGNFEFPALCHRMNKIIQQRLVGEITKQPWLFLAPELHLRPFYEGDSVAPACEDARRKVGVSTPIKFGVKSF